MSGLARARAWAYGRLHDLSLTARLVTVVVALVLIAFVTTTALTVTLLRGYFTDRTDENLETYIRPLAAMAVSRIIDEQRPWGVAQSDFVPPDIYYVILTPRGSDRAAAVAFPASSHLRPPEVGAIAWDDERLGTPFTQPASDDGVRWRILAKPLTDGRGTVAVAVPLSDADGAVRQLVQLSLVIGLSTLLAVALLGWFAVRRAFRPLTRIEDTAAAIAAGDLTRRVPERNATDEVASLSASLNQMLARIEQSFAVREASERRMRQFVADASHELRTPLATVRGYAELYRAGGVREPEDVATAMRRIENEATRMSRLVEDMLLLTRLDSGPTPQRTPVDLTVLAADTVQDARVRAPQRSVRLVPLGAATGPVMAVGDDHALRQVLANLVANALAHTPEGSPVEVATGVVGGHAVVEVRDHGPGIPPDVADRVFERFYRADPSRSRAQGGTGLGLAIVAAIVGAHRGTVRHVATPGGGATFRVSLPVARQPAPAQASSRP